MKRMLFNATYAEELRVASVEGKKLLNFDIETSSKEQRRGNIYKGFVTRVEPSLEACFVDYGNEKQGFLPFKEIDYRYLPEVDGKKQKDFSKLPLGTEMIIQVEKDERGNKGAALTTYVTLPGRYLVLMPNNSRSGGISRRIEGAEREELKGLMSQLSIPQGMSVILRTAAIGRASEELAWDLTYLTRLWEMILKASEDKGAFLIYLESSLVIRSIRDHFSPDISEILIDTEEVYNQARNFMSLVMPNFADRVKHYHDDVPLFSRFQIEHQIESAYARMVTLPSGGVIVIDQTEALTAVDVNSAKANKGADIETTAFLTNLEAAEEVARQLRLRDLGGLVVVDFIDMENTRNQRDLEDHFQTQLSIDRARIQMGKLSKFGLLELSRQRLQASLEESTTITCPRCSGVGSIRGIESNALHILRLIQDDAVKNSGHLSALHVQLPVDIATYLLNERREDVAKIEARMKVKIVLVPNVHLNSPHYKIKRLTYDNYDNNFFKTSYNLVEAPEEVLGYNAEAKKNAGANKIPAVQQISDLNPAPVVERKSKSIFAGILKAISSWFSSPEPQPTKGKHRNGQFKNKPKREHNNLDRNNQRNNRNKDARDNSNTKAPLERNKPNALADKPKLSQDAKKQSDENRPQNNQTERNDEVVTTRPNQRERNSRYNKERTNDRGLNQNDSSRKVQSNNDNLTNASSTVVKVAAKLESVVEQTPIEDKVIVKIADTQINNAPVAVEVAKPIVKEVVHVKVEEVDLGNMELIATNAELVVQTIEPEIDTTSLRFKDVERSRKPINNDIEYEIVETKN